MQITATTQMYNEINKISIDIKQIHNNFLGVK